jgi:hypothetical protein
LRRRSGEPARDKPTLRHLLQRRRTFDKARPSEVVHLSSARGPTPTPTETSPLFLLAGCAVLPSSTSTVPPKGWVGFSIGDEARGGHVDAPMHRGRQQNTTLRTHRSHLLKCMPRSNSIVGVLLCAISLPISRVVQKANRIMQIDQRCMTCTYAKRTFWST